MKKIILFLYTLISCQLYSRTDSSIYKLCRTIDSSIDHQAGVDIINKTLQESTLNSQEKFKLNSLLVKKLLQVQKFDQALKISEEQVIIAKKEKNTYYEASFYNNIGNTYFYLSNPKMANKFYEKGYIVAEKYKIIDLQELFNHNLGAISLEDLNKDLVTENYFFARQPAWPSNSLGNNHYNSKNQ